MNAKLIKKTTMNAEIDSEKQIFSLTQAYM